MSNISDLVTGPIAEGNPFDPAAIAAMKAAVHDLIDKAMAEPAKYLVGVAVVDTDGNLVQGGSLSLEKMALLGMAYANPVAAGGIAIHAIANGLQSLMSTSFPGSDFSLDNVPVKLGGKLGADDDDEHAADLMRFADDGGPCLDQNAGEAGTP